MFDCNLVKSKLQKLQEAELPNLYTSAIAQGPMAHQLPQAPGVPQTPGMPLTPAMPQMPGMPQMPVIPQVPTAPQTPQAPTTPQMPSMPTPTPFIPEVPSDQPTTPFPPSLPGPFPSSPPITIPANPLSPSATPIPIDYESLQYMNGYLRTQIGRYVEVEFLIGTTNRVIWVGILVGVGINYILLQDATTHDITACDFYNIKFFKSYAIDFV